MAGVAGDAHTPIYGYQWRAYFTTYNSSGAPTAVTATIDSEVSLDAGTFADCTNETVAIKEVGGSTDSANAYLDLTAAEMAAGSSVVQVKSGATAVRPLTIYPRVLPVWLTGTAQANTTATIIKLASTAPAYDLAGCWVGVDANTCAGEVRKISSYNTTTKEATVKRAFSGTGPDATSTYSVLVPEAMQGAMMVRVMLALPAVAAGAVSGLPLNDANSLVQADLARILTVAQSATDLKDFADTGYDPSTHLAQADVARLGGVAQSATDLKDFADTGYDPSTHLAQVDVAAISTDATAANNAELFFDGTGYAGGTIKQEADVVSIHGSALTETSAGYLAAAFVKLFDVASPQMMSTDWTNARAVLLDQLNGATDGTLCEIVKTVLTELSNRTYNSSLHDLLGIADTTGLTLLTQIAAGNVTNVTGAVATVNALATNSVTAAALHTDAVTEIQSGLATSANQTTILARIGDFAGTGLNSIKGFLQAMFRKDAGVTGANTPSEINEAENTVTGTFDGTTDSQEGIVDVGVNVKQISTDATAADNAELFFDGTGYAGGTTKLGVDVVSISSDTTAADNAELMFDGTGYAGGTTKLGVDVVAIGGGAQSATDAKDFVDTGYDPSTHKVAGVVTTDTATALGSDAVSAAALKTDAVTEIVAAVLAATVTFTNGQTKTVAECLRGAWAGAFSDEAIVATTLTIDGPGGTGTAEWTFTLDDADAPTSRTH